MGAAAVVSSSEVCACEDDESGMGRLIGVVAISTLMQKSRSRVLVRTVSRRVYAALEPFPTRHFSGYTYLLGVELSTLLHLFAHSLIPLFTPHCVLLFFLSLSLLGLSPSDRTPLPSLPHLAFSKLRTAFFLLLRRTPHAPSCPSLPLPPFLPPLFPQSSSPYLSLHSSALSFCRYMYVL